jgi:hypothetical protein
MNRTIGNAPLKIDDHCLHQPVGVSLAALGPRSTSELIRLVNELESGGVGFCALKAAFDTTTAHYHRT